MILLSDDWLPSDDVGYDTRVISRIKAMALSDEWVRPHKLIGETQLCHYPITSLDRPIPLAGGDMNTLGDLVVDRTTLVGPSLDFDLEDPQLLFIMGALKPDETAVLQARAEDRRNTWEIAAGLAEVDPSCGERTRRKINRLVAEYNRRHPDAEGGEEHGEEHRPRLSPR